MNALLPFLAAALAASASPAAVPPAGFSLDNVFADHMVLQRGKPLRFSGWADPGTRVTCSFHGRDVTAAAGADGRWLAELPPEEAGGPYWAVDLKDPRGDEDGPDYIEGFESAWEFWIGIDAKTGEIYDMTEELQPFGRG